MNQDSVIPQIKDALQEPIPARKYTLWQPTQDGKICGYYWKDIDSAWRDSTLPGWWYVIRKADGEVFVHESTVEVAI